MSSSALHRSAISARLAKLPPMPPTVHPSLLQDVADGDEEEDEEADGDSLGDLPGTGMGPPAVPRRAIGGAREGSGRQREAAFPQYAPLSGADFFEQAFQVDVHLSDSAHLDMRVYYTPPVATPSQVASTVPTPELGSGSPSLPKPPVITPDPRPTILLCLHGAGGSGLSFGVLAKEVCDLLKVRARQRSGGGGRGLGVMAVDLRAHGKTTASPPSLEEDLSLDALARDVLGLARVVWHDVSDAPRIILVGHSMGGAIATRACPLLQEAGYKVEGVAVLDVVEGTAIAALPHMHSLLNARPDGFGSVEEGVRWHMNTQALHNRTSARLSIPPTLVEDTAHRAVHRWKWRTTLRQTAPFWSDWFTSLSPSFLSLRTARLLILSRADLDRPLTVGHMQGKFQLEMLGAPGVGHAVHEDDPTHVAEVLLEFWRRNQRGVVGIKKVGEV